jgi:hypothetical protein
MLKKLAPRQPLREAEAAAVESLLQYDADADSALSEPEFEVLLYR